MARLNESTASAEPIEILKRRFVRQNREIARVNSIQSLRIRSLESEVSHLLSENVSLRERVISLSQEIERFEAAKLFQDGVYDIRAKLSTKLMELGGLVADLGAFPRNVNKSASGTTENAHQSQRTLDLRHNTVDFETNTGLSEDGRLPVILENKYYPRETLEPQEIQELMSNEMDVSHSSELEVPTIRKDKTDDDSYPKSPENVTDIQASNGGNELLPPTLEARKKKKPSPSLIRESVYNSGVSEFPPHGNSGSGSQLKSGVKRKFSSDNDGGFELMPAEEDDFQFSRPSHPPQMTHDLMPSTGRDHPSIKKQVSPTRSSKSDERPKRRVLEPKSTNMSSTELQAAKVHDQGHKVLTRLNDESDENRTVCSTQLEKGMHCENVTVDEKSSRNATNKSRQEASGSEELQSKASEAKQSSLSATVAVSQVQTAFEGPANLSSASSRSTRRQRSVVSYAEPNLRDKMRRPTKEFIAAVGGEYHSRRISSSQSVLTTSNDEFDERKSDKVNARKTLDSNTENMDFNPVRTACSDDSLRQTAHIAFQRKRKTSPASKKAASTSHDSTDGITEAHSHWIVGNGELDGGLHVVTESLAENTKEQGPAAAVDSKEVPIEFNNIPRAAPVSSRQSRRHSSNPKSSVRCHSPGHEIGATSIEGSTASGAYLGHSDGTSKGNIDQSKASVHASEEDFRVAMGLAIDARRKRVPRAGARRRSMML